MLTLLSVIAFMGPLPQEAAKLAVRPVSIAEARYLDLDKKDEDSQRFNEPDRSLTVTVDIKGPATVGATHYGHITFKSATLDGGGKLKAIKPEAFGFEDARTEYVEINRDMMFMGQMEKPKDVLRVALSFEPPPREAKTIKLIDGALKLRTGRLEDVLIGGLAGKIGSMIEDKTLAQAKLRVKLLDPKEAEVFGEPNPAQTVALHISGNLSALTGVAIVNASGEGLNAGTMSSGSDDERSYVLETMEDIPADARLKFTVAVDQQELEVPFKLENLPLP